MEIPAGSDAGARSDTFALPPTGAIEISGSDARAFLQGQLTSDILKLDARMSQLSAWCNRQGRVIATLRIVDRGESLLLLLPLDQAQHVAERLRGYVLRAKVRIRPHEQPIAGVGLQGPAAAARLAEAGLPALSEVNAAFAADDAVLVRVPGSGARYELYGCEAERSRQALWPQSAAGHPADGWRAGNIEAGLPVVHAVNRERFLPQMLNLDRLDGISFAKGCYTGQEIVARTQNLGRVKRRMRRFGTDISSAAGDTVFAAGSPVGSVVEVASRDDRVEMLAVVPLIADESFTIGTGNVRLQELPLVY